jgi:hypothetical protein
MIRSLSSINGVFVLALLAAAALPTISEFPYLV